MQIERTTLSAKEAAEFLGISYWKLLELRRTKEIPCIDLGKKLLFRIESLKQWQVEAERKSMFKDDDVHNAINFGAIREIKA